MVWNILDYKELSSIPSIGLDNSFFPACDINIGYSGSKTIWVLEFTCYYVTNSPNLRPSLGVYKFKLGDSFTLPGNSAWSARDVTTSISGNIHFGGSSVIGSVVPANNSHVPIAMFVL